MSRLELSAIQTKLKAAIQSHQMLVVKMKGDSQNSSLKKGLTELQEEIKRLSEEQKKIVVRVRENLVKSSSQPPPQPPVAPIVTLGQTITAIGQPRLVSFPTQGGATILPVGMVAVPIAHMQRPAVGMTIHPANAGAMSQAQSISLVPTGIFGGGCNISLSPINSGATISLGSTVSGILHSNLAISNIGSNNLISTTTSGGVSSNPSLGIIDNTIPSNAGAIVGSTGGCASIVSGCIPSNATALTNLTNMTNLIIGTSISNGHNNNSHILTHSLGGNNCQSNIPVTSALLSATSVAPMNTISVSGSGPGIVISQFPQQPLVQPQLLQQQQQQILQMIQQQQQQPQQRLVSHTPIKVPQYTASIIRPSVNSTSVQFCNIAPAPTTVSTTSSVRVVSSSTSLPLPAKPTFSKEVTVLKEQQMIVKQDPAKPHPPQAQPRKQQHKQHEIPQEQRQPEQMSTKALSPEEQEKLIYMKALDLYTLDALKEVMNRRSERKRRTTANPNYSFGFEYSRRDRNGCLWTTISPKKPRTRGKGSGASGQGNGWTDSTSFNQQQSRSSITSNRSNDNHDDYCAACGKGGQLLMCETCRLVYHLDCLNPPLTEAPKYVWSCPKCLISGKGFAHLNSEALAKVHSYIAKKTAKEDEKKKLQKRGKEINSEKNFVDNRSKELESQMKKQTDLQSTLSSEEIKVKEELNKLSDFVRAMRESRTTDHLSGTRSNST